MLFPGSLNYTQLASGISAGLDRVLLPKQPGMAVVRCESRVGDRVANIDVQLNREADQRVYISVKNPARFRDPEASELVVSALGVLDSPDAKMPKIPAAIATALSAVTHELVLERPFVRARLVQTEDGMVFQGQSSLVINTALTDQLRSEILKGIKVSEAEPTRSWKIRGNSMRLTDEGASLTVTLDHGVPIPDSGAIVIPRAAVMLLDEGSYYSKKSELTPRAQNAADRFLLEVASLKVGQP